MTAYTDTDTRPDPITEPAPPPAATAAPAAAKRVTVDDMLASFDGWEEIAVEQQFGKPWTAMVGTTTINRAAYFILRRRTGMTDGDAYRDAMGKSLLTIREAFAAEDDDDQDAAVRASAMTGDPVALTALAARPEA